MNKAKPPGLKGSWHRIIGQDAEGKPVHIGDVVDHPEQSLKGGVVVYDLDPETASFNGEPVAVVAFSEGRTRITRFSRMVVTGTMATEELVSLVEKIASRSESSWGRDGLPAAARFWAKYLPKSPAGPEKPELVIRKLFVQGGRVESKR